MANTSPIEILGAVEGLVDEAVLRSLVREAGAKPGTIHGKNGKAHLHNRLGGYNQAARHLPWVVLVDLDHDEDCAPPLVISWIPKPAPLMRFRVAVREVEAWLLADKERLARFLSVAVTKVPRSPDAVDDPKQTMVNLARQSRRRDIREDMVPRPASGRYVGPAYASRLIEFVESSWRPAIAAGNSDSLRRCRQRLGELVQQLSDES